jgi:hypothetical protein
MKNSWNFFPQDKSPHKGTYVMISYATITINDIPRNEHDDNQMTSAWVQ